MTFIRSTLFALSIFGGITAFTTTAVYAMPTPPPGEGYICSLGHRAEGSVDVIIQAGGRLLQVRAKHRQGNLVSIEGTVTPSSRDRIVTFQAAVARGRIINGFYNTGYGDAIDLMDDQSRTGISSTLKSNLWKVRRYAACCANDEGPSCMSAPVDEGIIITRGTASLEESGRFDQTDLDGLFKPGRRSRR